MFQKYSSLYCLKLMGAFFIICIHCWGGIIYDSQFLYYSFTFFRIAVPIFFIISGFFLYRSDEFQTIYRLKQTFIKIFWITVYANILYLLIKIPHNFNFNFLVDLILWGDKNGGGHLWYLNAYLETLLVMMLFAKLRKLDILWCLIPFLVVLGLLAGKYNTAIHIISYNFTLSRCFLTVGIPCVGAGYLIAKYKDELLTNIRYPILGLLFIILLSEFEAWLFQCGIIPVQRDADIFAMTIPFAVMLFICCLKFPRLGENSIFEKWGWKYSTYIYIFHILIIGLIGYKINVTIGLTAKPFLILFATILFVVIWRKSTKHFFEFQ